MRRLAIGLALVLLWASFGFGVYHFLESRKSDLVATLRAAPPTAATPSYKLNGAIYVSQGGQLYRYAEGRFSDLNLPTSDRAWIEPAAGPGGNLLVAARFSEWSDIFLVNGQTGRVIQQLTSNADTTGRIERNAWSFWPHLAADGTTLISGWDGPKTGSFEVDFAVWSGTVGGKVDATRWTTPNGYTGGDVSPVPLPGGGVVYAKYAINSDNSLGSRLAIVARAKAVPTYITAAADDCNAPAVSPDGTELAMICTSDTQSARLELMPLVNGVPGTPKVLVDNCLCASPAFSPDGHDLVYYAPVDSSGHFELWWLKNATAAAPAAPLAVTSHLDLDATSPPAWVSS